ncbi:MAG: glycosyltransferase [Candidatus Nanoarchaeia archaeon]
MKKVIWISSYLPRSCGIAYYSQDYLQALKNYMKKTGKQVSIKIIAHTDAEQADYPIIDNVNDKKWHYKVLEVIKKEKPDLIHIQHEYGLYETDKDKNQRVIELIKLLKEANYPVVMTYHSVYNKLERYQAKFMSETLKLLDAGIVHEAYQKQALPKNIGWKPSNLHVLPHGSKEHLAITKKQAREAYNYDNKLVVGSAGLADERKGFIELIKQWPKVIKKVPNALLSLELKPHFTQQTRIYIDKVLEEILKSKSSDSIEFIVKDYSVKEFYKKLKAFDILVLPYKHESQSGVLAHGLAANTPAIVTDIEGLGAEIRNSNAGIAVKNKQDFHKAIIKLLKNKKLRNKYQRNAKQYVKQVAGWSIIARKTFNIWKQISF